MVIALQGTNLPSRSIANAQSTFSNNEGYGNEVALITTVYRPLLIDFDDRNLCQQKLYKLDSTKCQAMSLRAVRPVMRPLSEVCFAPRVPRIQVLQACGLRRADGDWPCPAAKDKLIC